MKRVTKNNLIKLVNLMKEYEKTKDNNIKEVINNYIDNVINKDSRYYAKLGSYGFDNEILKYLM